MMANRPRYGGYVAHLAVVMVALGVVGQSFYGVQRDVALFPGEEVTIEDYRMVYVDTTALAFEDRTEFRTTVEVYRDGELLAVMQPRRTFSSGPQYGVHAGGDTVDAGGGFLCGAQREPGGRGSGVPHTSEPAGVVDVGGRAGTDSGDGDCAVAGAGDGATGGCFGIAGISSIGISSIGIGIADGGRGWRRGRGGLAVCSWGC